MAGIASFHLTTVSTPAAPWGLARLGLDRAVLPRVPGLRFWRLLGTGRGSDTGPGADLRRTALFAVWDDDAALDAFLVSRRSRHPGTVESYVVRLRGLGGHGRWNGFDVLGAIDPAPVVPDAPVAVLTRARVHARHWRTFAAASKVVSVELTRAEGLLAVCGIGEAPVGRQATFSLWASAAAARRYAFDTAEHVEVVRRTRDERWYGEELFASFGPSASIGTWGGRDPLS